MIGFILEVAPVILVTLHKETRISSIILMMLVCISCVSFNVCCEFRLKLGASFILILIAREFRVIIILGINFISQF